MMLNRPSTEVESSQAESAVVAPPCAMVIFGAAGDLTKRLVVPALYNLVAAGRLPDGFRLVGVDLADQDRRSVAQSAHRSDRGIRRQGWRVRTQPPRSGHLGVADRAHELCAGRSERSRGLSSGWGASDRARQDERQLRATICSISRSRTVSSARPSPASAAAGLTKESEGQWRRVVIEKPFGHDLASAKALNAEILKTLEEHQIYRIDHFLGKETVQNIMALRFANGLFEPLWNRAAHRPRPDHRGGDRRRRAPRQILRKDRRAARHGAEPRVPAAGDDRDGAADLVRCRRGAGQEGRGDRRRSSRSSRRRR